MFQISIHNELSSLFKKDQSRQRMQHSYFFVILLLPPEAAVVVGGGRRLFICHFADMYIDSLSHSVLV